MKPQKSSNNRKILRTISSKIRQLEATSDIQYLLIYAFLYKYCSDILKDYFLSVIEDREITLDEAYDDEGIRLDFRNDAFHMFGYFIRNCDYFIDDVINSKYSDRFFIHEFFNAFTENVEFAENSNYQQYFDFIFDCVRQSVNFSVFEFEGESHLIVKDIIYSISKLDVFEEGFPFRKVFDRVCQSKPIQADHDPDYINFLISSIVSSNVTDPQDVYNPFLNDASLLINLYSDYEFSWLRTYAKSQDRITYCCSLVKLLIHHFDLDDVYSQLDNPFEPFSDSIKFDVIMSRFPPITAKNLKRLNITQNYEMAKRNRRKEIQTILADKYNINKDSFENDGELNDALENLISKMDLDSDIEVQFDEEYESLKDSEYLFLINMINSLKEDGMMVVGMSQSFLVKNSLEMLRKYLIHEKNHIDAIISIPEELSRPSRLEIIVVFKKNRYEDDIVFIDMSTDFKTEKAPYTVPGLFKRNRVLDDKTTQKVCEVYKNRQTFDKFSNVVETSEIADNNFNLSMSRYVDTFEGEFINLKDLKNQKDEIDDSLEKLNEKIEKMMRDLDIKI